VSVCLELMEREWWGLWWAGTSGALVLRYVSERNLLSGIGAGEGGVGHGEVGWVGVWGEGGGENLGK
jgi:hypothetical protein